MDCVTCGPCDASASALIQKPRRGAGVVTETLLPDQFDFVVSGAVGEAVGSEAGIVAGAAVAGCSFRGIGITKLAGYCRCLSVIESVIPKSMNTALATIFASIVLGMEPVVSRPSNVLQRHFSGSSDRRTATVTGIGVAQVPRLFSNTHSPLLPSLNETATGVIGSLVSVAQPTVPNAVASATRVTPKVRFITSPDIA